MFLHFSPCVSSFNSGRVFDKGNIRCASLRGLFFTRGVRRIEKNKKRISILQGGRMIEGIKSLVRYYENLSFISCLLVGLGFHFVERPRGLGITGLLVSLFFFFVVILCLIYRNI